MRLVIILALLCVPFVAHGQGYNIPFSPQAAGSSTFCDSAPTNEYCQDFEVTGSTCTSENPAFDSGTADCGFTPMAGGDAEAMQVSGTETAVAADSYSHNDTSCVTFDLKVTTAATSGGGTVVWSATSTGGADTYPRLESFTGPPALGLQCASGSEAGDFVYTIDVEYTMEIEFINSTGVCEFWVDTVSQGSNNGADNPANDVGYRFTGVSAGPLVWVIDNYYISSGVCPS